MTIAVDASVAVPLLVRSHQHHTKVVRWWDGQEITLSGQHARTVHVTLSRLGIAGGAVYDGLVALAAREHGMALATRDARARGTGNSYNDWLAPGNDDTPPELLATAYWAHDAALMAEIAEAAGRAGQAAGYRALGGKLRSSFINAFVDGDGQVASGTQTAYVLALHMHLRPGDLQAAAADHLVAAIEAAGWHLTTGFADVGYLLPVLSSTGHTAAAYRLLEQDTMPSWRYRRLVILSGAAGVQRRQGRLGRRPVR